MKPVGFVTVRTSSSRLPQKCLMPFGEVTVIEHIILRAQHYGIEPIVCTSEDPSDDILEQIAKKRDVRFYRGSLINKLKRWRDCCEHFGIKAFHTIDADDPFFDGEDMKLSLKHLQDGFDVVCPSESSSAGGASVGYSLTSSVVHQACQFLDPNQDTEMMWYYLDKVANLKKMVLPESDTRLLKMRLTLDYPEDYWLLSSIQRMAGHFANRKQINDLFERNPDLYLINWFRNDEWKRGQLAKKV